MSENSSSTEIKRVFSWLSEVSGYAAVVASFFLAISGRSPLPLPKTTSVITVVVATVVLESLRWPHIIRKVESNLLLGVNPLVSPDSKSVWMDWLNTSSSYKYSLSLVRRRVEGSLLILLGLTSIGWTVVRLPSVIAEVTEKPGSELMSCNGLKTSEALRVIIADFNEVGPHPNFLIEDRLSDYLGTHAADDSTICRLKQVISSRSEAISLGEKEQAAIVIWGRSDVVFETHIEVAGWDLSAIELPPRPSEEVADFAFQVKEPIHIGFLTEFALSEIYYLNNQLEQAQQLLSDALWQAEEQGLGLIQNNAQELGEAYYLLGFLFDRAVSEKPDPAKALEAYSRAFYLNPTLYGALLNKGKVFEGLEQNKEAIDTYTQLIEDETPLAAPAAVNRAFLQNERTKAEEDFALAIQLAPTGTDGYWNRGNARLYQWNDETGAIEDFQKAVELSPEDFFLHHSLGQAQLFAGELDDARSTYRDVIPMLDIETRQVIVQDLEMLTQDQVSLEAVISGIIQDLETDSAIK